MIAVLATLLLQAPDTARWQAGARYAVEAFDGPRQPWHHANLTLGVQLRRVTLIGEQNYYKRFGAGAASAGGEIYWRALPKATIAGRLQLSPRGSIAPKFDGSAELTVAVLRGWELSAGARTMHYLDADASIANAGIARYTGPWYLRARASVVFNDGTAGGGSITVRRYTNRERAFVELNAGAGNELVTLQPGIVERRRTSAAAMRWRGLVSRSWGLETGVSWAGDEGTPARYGLSVGAYRRW